MEGMDIQCLQIHLDRVVVKWSLSIECEMWVSVPT